MKIMTVSLSPDPSPASGEGRFVGRWRDFYITPLDGRLCSDDPAIRSGKLARSPQ